AGGCGGGGGFWVGGRLGGGGGVRAVGGGWWGGHGGALPGGHPTFFRGGGVLRGHGSLYRHKVTGRAGPWSLGWREKCPTTVFSGCVTGVVGGWWEGVWAGHVRKPSSGHRRAQWGREGGAGWGRCRGVNHATDGCPDVAGSSCRWVLTNPLTGRMSTGAEAVEGSCPAGEQQQCADGQVEGEHQPVQHELVGVVDEHGEHAEGQHDRADALHGQDEQVQDS